MKKIRSDPRRWLKLLPVFALAFALTLFVLGSAAAPTFATSAGTGDAESLGDAILGVFTQVGEWLATAVPSFMPMFYDAASGLTFLGWLAVAGLAFSVVFLCIGIIQRFMRFGG